VSRKSSSAAGSVSAAASYSEGLGGSLEAFASGLPTGDAPDGAASGAAGTFGALGIVGAAVTVPPPSVETIFVVTVRAGLGVCSAAAGSPSALTPAAVVLMSTAADHPATRHRCFSIVIRGSMGRLSCFGHSQLAFS
jgi:hypothetical protein